MKEQELLAWFEHHARPFFERNAKDRIAGLECTPEAVQGDVHLVFIVELLVGGGIVKLE